MSSGPSSSRLRKIPRLLRASGRVLLILLFLPYIVYELWRALGDLDERRWSSLATRSRRLQRLGFHTPTSCYWLGVASARLLQWETALAEFERIDEPLDTSEEEAARYAFHAWVLHNLGRTGEARDLVRHALKPTWPADRRDWAEDFLGASYGSNPSEPSEGVLH